MTPGFEYTFPYDSFEVLYAPGEPLPDHYTRTEAYIWAVPRARGDMRVPLDHVICCLPDREINTRVWAEGNARNAGGDYNTD